MTQFFALISHALIIVGQVVAFMIKISIFRLKAVYASRFLQFIFSELKRLLVKNNQLYHQFQLILYWFWVNSRYSKVVHPYSKKWTDLIANIYLRLSDNCYVASLCRIKVILFFENFWHCFLDFVTYLLYFIIQYQLFHNI